MSQTTAPAINMANAFAGLIAESYQPKDIVSRINVAAAMKIGYLASLDSGNGDDAVKAPAASTDVTDTPSGFIAHTHALESSETGDPQFPVKSALNIMRKGRIWVPVEDAVTVGAGVYVRFQNGSEGLCRSDADAGNAALLPSAKFVTSTTGAGLAMVEINLP